MIDYKEFYEGIRPQIAIDFDNTLARHDAGMGMQKTGEPIPGAIEFVKKLHQDGWEVWIFSARCYDPKGTQSIKDWLTKHGLISIIRGVTNEKSPGFVVMVDDRAIEFRGDYNEVLKKLNDWK